MTTKDQAIAQIVESLDLERLANLSTGRGETSALNYRTFATLLVGELQAQPPAPDCRTCTDYDRLEGCLRAPRYGVCTNGDQYQPAPKVVLWRTEQ